MKTLFISLISILAISCNTKPEINFEALAVELDSIMSEDQRYRNQITEVYQAYGSDSKEFKELWQKQNVIDSSNLLRITEIIDQVGSYPGESLVGSSAGEVAFFVLQHAPDSIQEKYYDLIVTAGKDKELKIGLVTMYQDRYLINRNQPQLFGTQIGIKTITDRTGKSRDSAFLYPISDTTRIDSLRLWNGHGPLEEYLNYYGLSRWK